MNAQIKITEAWKSCNIEDYPIKIKLNMEHDDQVATRAMIKFTTNMYSYF